MALLDGMAERDPLYKPGFGNRVFLLSLMGKGEEARVFLDGIEPYLPGDPNIEASRAWIDFQQGKAADGVRRMESSLEKQPTDRAYKVGVNHGNYRTHQYERVFDDHFSRFIVLALFNLDRIEEANIVAQEKAANGVVAPLFAFLNASDQSELLVDYFEDRWPNLEAFQQEVPAFIFGYGQMADIALAYQRTGNEARFNQAMELLDAANLQSLSQGIVSNDLLILLAAQHAMAGDTEQALTRLAEAIDGGLITSAKISREYPHFRGLDGNPRYEAIQARMIEHLNRERAQLGLEPISG